MDKEICYYCKKTINCISDIYNHASLYKEGKTILTYFCSFRCWTDFNNSINSNLNHK